ncbi:MAG: lysostaphin resistance A-like protein [Candidatus Thorarchaeota archaeon]
MNEVRTTSVQEDNPNSLQNRVKSLFNNNHVIWTTLILWFFLAWLGLSLMGTIIPDSEIVILLVLLFPIVYLFIPLVVIQITTRYFTSEETSLNTLWGGETPRHERNYILYHIGFVYGIYFTISQFGLGILMFPLALIVFYIGLRKRWLLQTDGGITWFQEYFTRLDKRQVLLLLFMFVGLAGGMTYIGYVIIFLYIAAIIVHDKVTPTQLGCRGNHALLLIPILIVLILPGFIFQFIVWPSVGLELLGGDEYPLLQVLYMYLVVGFAEEISFRAVFQTYMERRFGDQRGIVLTATLFTVGHIPSHILGSGLFLGSFTLMLVFYSSLLYGYVWFRTRNLWVIAGAHMLNDSTATILYNLLGE